MYATPRSAAMRRIILAAVPERRRPGDDAKRRYRAESMNQLLGEAVGKRSVVSLGTEIDERQHRERRRRRPGGERCGRCDRGDVRAFRQVDADRIVTPVQAVVGVQSRPETVGVDAHDRIGLRVERRRPTADLQRNRVFLDRVLTSRQRLLHDEPQERLEPAGLRERRAADDSIEVFADERGWRDWIRHGNSAQERGHLTTRTIYHLHAAP